MERAPSRGGRWGGQVRRARHLCTAVLFAHAAVEHTLYLRPHSTEGYQAIQLPHFACQTRRMLDNINGSNNHRGRAGYAQRAATDWVTRQIRQAIDVVVQSLTYSKTSFHGVNARATNKGGDATDTQTLQKRQEPKHQHHSAISATLTQKNTSKIQDNLTKQISQPTEKEPKTINAPSQHVPKKQEEETKHPDAEEETPDLPPLVTIALPQKTVQDPSLGNKQNDLAKVVEQDVSTARQEVMARRTQIIEQRVLRKRKLMTITNVLQNKEPWYGPTKESNWVIPGRLLVGAYPLAWETKNKSRKTTVYKRDLSRLLDVANVNIFVCLQDEHCKVARGTSSVLRNNKTSRVVRLASHVTEPRDRSQLMFPYMEDAADLAGHDDLRLLHLPIVDLDCTSDDDVLDLAAHLTQLIASEGREVIYVHCWGGHGRTGTVVAILLSLYYGIDAEEALTRTQLYHDIRRTKLIVKSPQTEAQCNQVRRILASDRAKELCKSFLHMKVDPPALSRFEVQWRQVEPNAMLYNKAEESVYPQPTTTTTTSSYTIDDEIEETKGGEPYDNNKNPLVVVDQPSDMECLYNEEYVAGTDDNEKDDEDSSHPHQQYTEDSNYQPENVFNDNEEEGEKEEDVYVNQRNQLSGKSLSKNVNIKAADRTAESNRSSDQQDSDIEDDGFITSEEFEHENATTQIEEHDETKWDFGSSVSGDISTKRGKTFPPKVEVSVASPWGAGSLVVSPLSTASFATSGSPNEAKVFTPLGSFETNTTLTTPRMLGVLCNSEEKQPCTPPRQEECVESKVENELGDVLEMVSSVLESETDETNDFDSILESDKNDIAATRKVKDSDGDVYEDDDEEEEEEEEEETKVPESKIDAISEREPRNWTFKLSPLPRSMRAGHVFSSGNTNKKRVAAMKPRRPEGPNRLQGHGSSRRGPSPREKRAAFHPVMYP